jgi:hypothetical protein
LKDKDEAVVAAIDKLKEIMIELESKRSNVTKFLRKAYYCGLRLMLRYRKRVRSREQTMPSRSSITMAPLIRWRLGSSRAMSIWINIVEESCLLLREKILKRR